MPLILPGNVASALGGGYEVANSCRFDRGSSAYMHKTPGSSGSQTTWTISAWVKRANEHGTNSYILDCGAGNGTSLYFGPAQIEFWDYQSGYTGRLTTNAVYRDHSAWYHIVAVWDTTNGTAGDRMKLYVNGTEVTSFATDTNPSSSQASILNSTTKITVGSQGTSIYANLYMAEVCFIDGQALTPTSFGEFDDDSPTIWKPKDVSGLTFGTNGFYLDFEDSANLGNDANGGTDLTEVNLAATDQATDSPTNNFCTLNPLEAVTATTTYAEGNMQGTTSNAARATFAVTNGKWYWEHKFVNKEAMGGVMAYNGFAPNAYTINALIQGSNPELVLNGTEQSSWSGDGTPDALVDNDILNVALDCDNNRIAFGVNGAWLNATDGSGEWSGSTLNYFSISDGYDYAPAFRTGSGTNRVSHMNFGGCPGFAISSGNADANGYGNFEYAVPSGFFSLCSKNLAEYG